MEDMGVRFNPSTFIQIRLFTLFNVVLKMFYKFEKIYIPSPPPVTSHKDIPNYVPFMTL